MRQKQSRSLRFDSETKSGGFQLSNREQTNRNRRPQMQFKRVQKKGAILSIRAPELGTSNVFSSRDHLSRLDQEGNGDAGGSRKPQT